MLFNLVAVNQVSGEILGVLSHSCGDLSEFLYFLDSDPSLVPDKYLSPEFKLYFSSGSDDDTFDDDTFFVSNEEPL